MSYSQSKAGSRKKSQSSFTPGSQLSRKPPSKSRRLRTWLPTIGTRGPKASSLALRLARGQKKIWSRPCNCLTRPSHATLCSLTPIARSRERMTGFISLATITRRRASNCPKGPCNQSAVCAPNLEKHIWPSPSIFTGRMKITTEPARS